MVHPSQAARLAAAWCIRCICIALPSQCTPLIDRYFIYLFFPVSQINNNCTIIYRCIENIESTRASPEIIFGYSAVLIGILGSVNISPLGIPHMRGKVGFLLFYIELYTV